jgi:hypothetical protein
MLTRLVLAGGLSIAILVPGAAAQGTDRPPLTLDFLAATADGKTPPDLTADDLTLKIDGRVRPMYSLELIAPPDGGRDVVLIVDEATLFGLEPVVKAAVAKLLESLLPGDRVAYVSTRRKGVTPMSPDHAIATRGLDAMVTGPGVLYTCLSDMLINIGNLAAAVRPGRSTTIAVISRGHPGGASYGGDGESSGCVPKREALRQLEDIVSHAQINLHLLTAGDMNRSWGLDTIARNTGGEVALLTWSDAGALDRAVQTTLQYYRATFEPAGRDTGRAQRLELRTRVPGLTLKTSPSFRPR